MHEVFLYNTFDRLPYSERVLLKYAMLDWCHDNIGPEGWINSNDLYEWRKFYFNREEDAIAFKLRFSTND